MKKWLVISLAVFAVIALAAGWLGYRYFHKPKPIPAQTAQDVPTPPVVQSAEPAAGVPVVPLKTGLIVKQSGEAKSSWTLNALGDIIIGRVVYQKVQQHGVLYPFLKMAKQVKDADLTTADQEAAISDAHTILCNTCMQFASPDRVADGLTYAGIDAMNLANNHSFNAGADAFVDTMNALKKRGIKYFGGGHNFTEAHTPLIMSVKGVKVAMLGYDTIVGGSDATATSPGMAMVGIAPWFPFNESQVRQMEADIKAAKAKADAVLVYYHWGTEYTHVANEEQRTVAHRALDAGATIVIGSHPHTVQGVEWYHGKLALYSLGNFVFDQEWSRQTKQGTFLKAKFEGGKLLSAELVPYRIDDYSQPGPVKPDEAAEILHNVFTHSWWPKA